MSLSDSDYSLKKQSYYSHMDEDITKSENDQLDQSLKIINKYSDKNSNKNIKNKKIYISDEKNEKNITKLYKHITKTLEKFIEKNYSDIPFVNSSLKMIFSHIKALLSSLEKTKNIKEKIKKNEDDKNILYEFKIDDLNQQIKDLKYELELLNINGENKYDDTSLKKYKIYTYLKKKNSKIENKSKLEEFKYLLYIQEQQNKINELEKKLHLKILENLKEAKESRCFPNINQYDTKEHINPKSIPLTESILKKSKSSKKKLVSKLSNQKKDYLMTITNSISKSKAKTPYRIQTEDIELNEKEKKKKVGFKENIFQKIDINDNQDKRTFTRNDIDFHFNFLKLNSETIPNRDKKYFISHPNLNIAGYNQKLNKYKMGVPSKIFSFKFSKNIDKNSFYKFPSILNEMFVELEKLRINANKSSNEK